jgi:hypothetical protein
VLAHRVEDHVVRRVALREVLAKAIDHLLGSERAHDLNGLRVADRRHLGLEVACEKLDSSGADRTARPVDEHGLPLERIRGSQAAQGEQRPVGHGRRFLEREPSRLRCDRAALGHGHVLGVRATGEAEHLVADCELGHGRPDLLDAAGELAAEIRPSRSADARGETGEAVVDVAHAHGVAAGDGRSGDSDEDLALLWGWPLDLVDAQHLRGPVPIVDDRSHRARAYGGVARLEASFLRGRAWNSRSTSSTSSRCNAK